MPSFFTSAPKKSAPVFAGLDDPFNFPTSKMRYTARSSRTASPDSGYGSIDDADSLSPKSRVPAPHKRSLRKDSNGHWRMLSYEHQSIGNDRAAEVQPILPDNEHVWRPDPRRTFALICDEEKEMEKPKETEPARATGAEKWSAKRVYGRALQRKERSEGISDLQRSMAPVLRRAPPSPSSAAAAPPPAPRKHSTLLHPSPPTPPPKSPRGRKPSTLLHPSAPRDTVSCPLSRPAPRAPPSSSCPPSRPAPRAPSPSSRSPSPRPTAQHTTHDALALRSPRHRSPTPLRIPVSSARQPAPTPLRIRMRRERGRGGVPGGRRTSVLHSCFSDDEAEGSDGSGSGSEVSDGEEGSGSEGTEKGVAGPLNEMILARTGMVARAQRVRVGVRSEAVGLRRS